MREEGVRVRGFAEDRGRLLALLSAIPVYPQEAPVAHISKATGFGGEETRSVLYRMSEAIPVAERKDGIVFFNPGSMSLPKGGWPASYGLYEDGRLSVHRVDDDSLLLEILLN